MCVYVCVCVRTYVHACVHACACAHCHISCVQGQPGLKGEKGFPGMIGDPGPTVSPAAPAGSTAVTPPSFPPCRVSQVRLVQLDLLVSLETSEPSDLQ